METPIWGPATKEQASHLALVVRNLPVNAGDAIETGLIPGLGRSPGGECRAAHSSILAWRTPWTKKLGRLQFIGSYRVGHD